MLKRTIVALLVLMASVSGGASEIQEIRLFFDTDKIYSPNEPVDLYPKKPPGLDNTSTPAMKYINPSVQIKYNGFISSVEGEHFFINGKSHVDTDQYKIMSVLNGGRLLELKLDSGKRVLIRIGQTIQVESL